MKISTYLNLGCCASLAAMLWSCNAPGPQESASAIRGIASPWYMKASTDTLKLQDYLPEGFQPDSVAGSTQYQTILLEDGQSLLLEAGTDMPYVANLRIYGNGTVNDIPVMRSQAEEMTFTLDDPDKRYSKVQVKGAFNGWTPERSPMNYAEGKWTYTARFFKGDHPYLFVADGVEMQDPSNALKAGNGLGGENSILRVGMVSEPNLLSAETGDNGKLGLSSEKPVTQLLVYLNNMLLPQEAITNIGATQWEIDYSAHKFGKRDMLRVYASDADGLLNDLLFPMEQGKIITDAKALERTDFHTQVMYFLMVDRFRDGNPANTRKVDNDTILPIANYFGGDLQGVIKTLEEGYFEKMGINTIWLSPITQNPEGAYGLWKEPYTRFSGYHGYWPVSNTKIDDRFGDEASLKELIEKAHAKGINVILDYVANHVHKEHPLYREHPDWATSLYLPDGTMNTERWDDHRLTTWFDTFLPTLDFSKPEVVEHMTDSAAYWVTHYDLDGFRHDATKHIQEDFWRTLTRKVKARTNRPVYQIGETYGSYDLIRSYINTGMLDAQFDFNHYDAAVSAFARSEASLLPLVQALKQGMEYYGSHHLMGNITGNQDRARFISYASGDVRFDEDAKKAGWTRDIEISDSTAYAKLEMLHAYNLFVPGVPCIYYGDEYGVPGGNDPDNRRQMKFEGLAQKEQSLRDKVAALVRERRSSMPLLYGSTEVLEASDQHMVIRRAYLGQEVIAVFNKSESPMQVNYFGKSVTVPAGGYQWIFNN